MIRRPATIISLGDEEVQCFLRHLFLRTLPVDFAQLHLGDPNESYGGDTLDDFSSDGPGVSSDSDGEFDHHALPVSVPGSSCARNSADSQGLVASTAPTALPAPVTAISLHRTTDPNEFSAITAPQISTMVPRHGVPGPGDRPLSKIASASTRQEAGKHSLFSQRRRRQGLSRPPG